jgi:hypothetical protein
MLSSQYLSKSCVESYPLLSGLKPAAEEAVLRRQPRRVGDALVLGIIDEEVLEFRRQQQQNSEWLSYRIFQS